MKRFRLILGITLASIALLVGAWYTLILYGLNRLQ